MKRIIIKRMTFLNFKGLRNLTVDFNESRTAIYGENGAGKSSIFDGFTWLLFGKDRKDRKKFGIKTYDGNNVVIPRIPHEVSAVILVDGEEITLCRRYVEKWQKERGSAVEEFKGHEEERLYNDVPCSVKEWNEKINAICPEQLFKYITSPTYFISQKPEQQREILFRMAGGVSDADVAAGNSDFIALLGGLSGKTIEEYNREIAAKKRRIGVELDTLPARIDERRRDLPIGENWDALIEELKEKQQALSDVEQQMLDAAEAQRAADDKRIALLEELNGIREERSKRTHIILENAKSEWRESNSARQALVDELADITRSILYHSSKYEEAKRVVNYTVVEREKLIAQWRELQGEAKRIQAEELSLDDTDFVCPQCGRPYDLDQIEEMQSRMRENFNKERSRRLLELSERIKENERRGRAIRKELDDATAGAEAVKKVIVHAEKRRDEICSTPLYKEETVSPDYQQIVDADEQIIALNKREAELEELYKAPAERETVTALQTTKQGLLSAIENLKTRLSARDAIAHINARIAELESQYAALSEEKASLEKIEFTIQAFSKARARSIEKKVNDLFDFVKFKLFETQINGAEIETCEALINGVPVSDANDAGRINAGLDIINAISRSEGMLAPIFLDNAESVNRLHPTAAQVIRLVVSQDSQLTVRSEYDKQNTLNL